MTFSEHAIQRLYERAPQLFKKYGFSLDFSKKKENLRASYKISQDMSKIEIPPDAIGMVLHRMERHGHKKFPKLFMLNRMLFVVYNNCAVTVYPADHLAMGFIQKFEEPPVIYNYKELVEYARKTPSKVKQRLITSYDEFDDIVELCECKGNLSVFVKQSKIEKSDFRLFDDSEYKYLTRVKNVDQCIRSISKGSFIKNSQIVHHDHGDTYYYVDIFEQHFYVVTFSHNKIAVLYYNNEPQDIITLTHDIATIKMQQHNFVVALMDNGIMSPMLQQDFFKKMMRFEHFHDEINNKTLSALGHFFKNYSKHLKN